MSTAPTRVGVIGVGSMGQNHARVYAELPDVELVGVADTDADRAREIAASHGTQARSRAELLDHADAVSIAVPTAHHADLARECIEADVDVLVEKPFVADPETGRELADLAHDRDAVIQVGHIERFNPAVRAVAEILDEQEIIAIDAQRLGSPRERTIADNAVMDLMIHDIDVVLSLIGEDVTTVNALGAEENRYIDAQLRFDGGVVASLTASRVTQKKIRQLSITTHECWIAVDYIDRSVAIHRHSLPEYVERKSGMHYRHEGVVERPMVDSGEPLKEELASFVDCVRERTTPLVTAEDGLRALSVARRIDRLADDRMEAEVR
ncbi:Gfo/Idh/MocA family protein [Halococcus thailandensis]|uniref:Oxidoreductase domain-containing protein n=1 Tax=Halococcus thailandensis JCM 13552 TaxID=1227457 RepID=M0MWA1_9EURY|nr:Gfo/Idh/MocA family oxidoreductase [Halococcus thailandensis]EMA49583.1 oxidoreductase domain-containing protein [Halococcus thailandensis JCM 13552]